MIAAVELPPVHVCTLAIVVVSAVKGLSTDTASVIDA
jgi:hypothetical protein